MITVVHGVEPLRSHLAGSVVERRMDKAAVRPGEQTDGGRKPVSVL